MDRDEQRIDLSVDVLVVTLSVPSDPPIPLEVAERQLDRLLAFFPRIDSKVSTLLAITFAQIGVGALNLEANDFTKCWITVPAVLLALAVAWVMLNLYRCAYPHLEGGHDSLVYFNEISKLRESEFVDRFKAMPQKAFIDDLAGQIWRNSEVLSCKYRYLKRATIGAILSLIPWTILVAATSLTHLKIPGSG